MASRLVNRLVLVSIAGALASLGACDCGTPPPQAGVARISARFPNGPAVQSDGQSVLQISLAATTAENTPDTAPISVTAGTGGVAARGATDFATVYTGNPTAEGVLDLDFICDFRSVESVPLEISNGTVETTITVRCIEPRGDTVIVVDDSDCNGFAADGESTCRVGVTVEQRASITIPLPGALEVRVLQATPANSGDTAVTQVLSTDGLSSESDEVTVIIDDEGHGEYFLHAPTVAETVQVELTSSGVTISREHDIDVFVNEASVDFPGGDIDVAGGNTGTIEIQVKNPAGDPADTDNDSDDILDIRIDGGDADTRPTLSAGGSTPAESLTGVTISNGIVSLAVATEVVTTTQVYTITVSYQPLQSLDPIERQVGVTVNPPGTLLLEVAATPTTIHSDSLTPSDLFATVNVGLTVDDNPASGGTATLTIPSDSSARIAFVGSDGVTETPEDDARSYTLTTAALASGSASVQVQVTPNVPTGVARIVVVGRDGNNNTAQREVVINVERAPILQAIVFDSASPSTIGVQGGSLASSSTVSFVLYDDAGRAMPNVGVSFSANATADRGITVTANAVSDAAGRVVTVLSAGTIPGPVTVLVSAESGLIGAGGAPILRTSQSNPIPIVGGLPSFETSSLECGPGGAAAAYAPYSISCAATLTDKFSNEVPGLLVQFSSEAGSEAASTSAAGGVASVTIASTEELRPMADVLGWSYGVAIPNFASQITALPLFLDADAAACFDALTSTRCDLLKLCNNANATLRAYCPLPENGGACLTSTGVAAGVMTASALLDDATLTPLTAATTRAGEVVSYLDNYRSCGFPVACLRGRQEGLYKFNGLGLDLVEGDYCPVNPGCLDFTTATECPQDSVRNIIASVRGAEAFSDNNGNGAFDYDDANNNAVHDVGEAVLGDAFVDMPEPFLDRNDNCFRDDASDNPRFVYRPIEKVRNTDQFSDVNGDDAFGFNGSEMSGAWDFDTTIFLTEKLLEIDDAYLEIGEDCAVAGAQHTCRAGGTRTCIELATGERFAPGCPVPAFSNNTTVYPGTVTSWTMAYRWTDANGNCPSVSFSDTSLATVDGWVNTTGNASNDLDQDFCGFVELMNPLLPHCTSVPFSAAPLMHLTITHDCEDAQELVSSVNLGFLLDGGNGRNGTEYESVATSLSCAFP